MGASPTINVVFDGADKRKAVDVRGEKGVQRQLLYEGDEPIKGTVTISLKPGQKLEHQGVKLELLGEIGPLLTFPPKPPPSFRSSFVDIILRFSLTHAQS